MKTTYAILLALCCCLWACKKDARIDVRDYGRVTIDSISPGKSPSDSYIKVYGKNFPYLATEIKAWLNKVALTTISVKADTILFYIPTGTTSGTLDFWFDRKDPEYMQFNYSGQVDSSANMLYTIDESYIPAPWPLVCTPAKGLPDSAVTISGYNFSKIQGAARVMFGTTAGEIVSITGTSVVVKVPNAPSGKVPLTITQGGHSASVDSFEILEPPPPILAMYWSDATGIQKLTFSNSAPPTLSLIHANSGLDGFGGVSTYDNQSSVDDRIWWTNSFFNLNTFTIDNFIQRSNTDGTDQIDAYPAAGTTAYDIRDLDIVSGQMVFGEWGDVTDPNLHCIKRRSSTGIRATTLLYQLPPNAQPNGIKAGKPSSTSPTGIWWAEQGTRRIVHGVVGGNSSEPATVLFDASDGLNYPVNIAVDEEHGKIYIMDVTANLGIPAIYKGNLDGSGSLTKLPLGANDLYGQVSDLEIDTKNEILYWSNMMNSGISTIMRGKTDGSNVQVVLDHLQQVQCFDLLLPQ